MNSRVLMVFAVLLFIGAGIAAYWGVSLSRTADNPPVDTAAQTAEVREPEPVRRMVSTETRVPVVVLARAVKALTPIMADDLAVEQLRIAPPDSFSDTEAVLRRTAWRDLPAGTVLNSASFDMGGPLARMIRAHERALALQVDEVVGGGGHLKPGDYVDVLLYLREDDKNRDRTVQVVVPAMRVLSVGAELGATNNGEAALPPPAADDKPARQTRQDNARTVVLAVPEALLTRFMLATQVGTLRLAVRSADEKLLADYYAGKAFPDLDTIGQQLFQFEKFALRNAARPQPGLVPPPPAGIPVYRGNNVSRHSP